MISKAEYQLIAPATKRPSSKFNDWAESSSSSFAANEFSVKKTSQQQQPEPEDVILSRIQRNNRRVTFRPDLNQEHNDSVRCQQDCHATWYTQQDYTTFKSHTQSCVRRALNTTPSLASCLVSELYLAICEHHQHHGEHEEEDAAIMAAHAACAPNMLTRVYQDNRTIDEFVGLEYYIVSCLSKDSRARKSFLQEVCLDWQCDAQECEMDNDDDDDNDEAQEELRQALQSVSRPAVILAHLLAL